ncbi:MAG: glycerophosphodiester phosphodiesterase family protein [Psychroserpens sp.]|uniref:glycerophosphodiester phosphodiesterase family protein n=1 Tax=Psychroserpens sp. TaxID=2020870 RepID=UPI003C8302B2
MRYAWIICLLVFNCTSKNTIDIQGHRGCRGLHPENSIPAFKKALELGVTTLELDVVISKDHKVVVSHEPFMNHLIAFDAFGNEITEAEEMSFNLYTMPYDSIVLYNCGTKRHPRFPRQKLEKVHKPLLLEVIDLAESTSKQNILYNIEIKSNHEYDGIFTPQLDKFVSLVLDMIALKGIEDRTTIQSFDLRALEETRRQNDDLQIALLIDENESIEKKLAQLSFEPEIISPYFKLLDLDIVSKFHDQGFKIIPWTINNISDIELMIDFEVDGIISDYPDRVIQFTANRN